MSLRKICNQCRPYSNCVTLRGQLANWTGEDIVKIATENIERIIEPIRGDLAEQTIWGEIEDKGGVIEFGNVDIKDSQNKNDDSYEWENL